jgi:hypothetical protein
MIFYILAYYVKWSQLGPVPDPDENKADSQY